MENKRLVTADAVRQMGYVLQDSGRKLTVGQQHPHRRTQRGAGSETGADYSQEDIAKLQDLADLEFATDSDDDQFLFPLFFVCVLCFLGHWASAQTKGAKTASRGGLRSRIRAPREMAVCQTLGHGGDVRWPFARQRAARWPFAWQRAAARALARRARDRG